MAPTLVAVVATAIKYNGLILGFRFVLMDTDVCMGWLLCNVLKQWRCPLMKMFLVRSEEAMPAVFALSLKSLVSTATLSLCQ